MSFEECFTEEIDSCPHCGKFSQLQHLHAEKCGGEGEKFNRYTLYRCTACKRPLLLDEMLEWSPSATKKTFRGQVVSIAGTYPIKSHHLNSSVVPPEISRDFEDGWRCFYAGIYNAAAVMFRRALEHSLLTRGVESSRELRKMIDTAFEKRLISEGEKEWIHEVRLLGNEAAHAIGSVSKKDVEQLGRFLEKFLRIFHFPPHRRNRHSGEMSEAENRVSL